MAELESYLTLSDAARKYGISIDALTRLVRDGIIRAVHNEEGDRVITVSTVAAVADVIRDEIRPEQYEHLRGNRLRAIKAAEEYGVDTPNLSNWIRYGYFRLTTDATSGESLPQLLMILNSLDLLRNPALRTATEQTSLISANRQRSLMHSRGGSRCQRIVAFRFRCNRQGIVRSPTARNTLEAPYGGQFDSTAPTARVNVNDALPVRR